jgi:hypothetical protein
MLVLHQNFVTKFFLEVGTAVNLVAIDIARSSRASKHEKEAENDD